LHRCDTDTRPDSRKAPNTSGWNRKQCRPNTTVVDSRVAGRCPVVKRIETSNRVSRRDNPLINGSRNKHRYQGITEAGRDTRRAVCSAVGDLPYTGQQDAMKVPTDNHSSCSSLAVSIFVNKVRNIKCALSSAFAGQQFETSRVSAIL